MRVKIEELPVRARELNKAEMQHVFGGAISSALNSSLASGFNARAADPMGCALCLGGMTNTNTLRPNDGGEWGGNLPWASAPQVGGI